jgi:hypothetical protein
VCCTYAITNTEKRFKRRKRLNNGECKENMFIVTDINYDGCDVDGAISRIKLHQIASNCMKLHRIESSAIFCFCQSFCIYC